MIPIKSVYSFLASLRGVGQISLHNMRDKDLTLDIDPTSLSQLKRIDSYFETMAMIATDHPYISVRFKKEVEPMRDLMIALEKERFNRGLTCIQVQLWTDPRPYLEYQQHNNLSNDAQAWLSPPKE